MHNFSRIMALVVAVLGATVPATAATPHDFYMGLLCRGVASYEASHHPDAATQLRIAAFGLVDTIDQYQLAQVYLTLTFEKLGQHDKAREAAQRVITAERVERKYAGLTAPAAVRTAFEATAARLLNPADVKSLREGTTPPRQAPQPSTSLRPTPAAPPAATPQPSTQQPASPQKATTTPPRTAAPAPQIDSARQITSPENVPPQTIIPVPPPETPKTQTANSKPPVKPPTTSTVTKPPATVKPAPSANPTPATVQPQRPATSAATRSVSTETNGRGTLESPRPPASSIPAPAPRPLTASEAGTRLAAAERALNSSNLSEARRAFRELLGATGLDHEMLIRLAEGLYRSRDFAGALNAFGRIGTLRRGEEPYQYYIAVAAYETGDPVRARKALAAALPFIEITPDVARYRGKIESSQ